MAQGKQPLTRDLNASRVSSPRFVYHTWRRLKRKAIRCRIMHAKGADWGFNGADQTEQDAAQWASILHGMTGVWPEYEPF